MENFLSSRKKISGESLPNEAQRPSQENQGMTKVEVAGTGDNQPKIELVTENGVIRTLIVNCKCGERIELKCHY